MRWHKNAFTATSPHREFDYSRRKYCSRWHIPLLLLVMCKGGPLWLLHGRRPFNSGFYMFALATRGLLPGTQQNRLYYISCSVGVCFFFNLIGELWVETFENRHCQIFNAVWGCDYIKSIKLLIKDPLKKFKILYRQPIYRHFQMLC